MNGTKSLPAGFYQLQKGALVVGVAALAGAAFVGWHDPAQREAFFRAYLFAWVFWLGMSLGSLVWVMMHHLMGAYWSRSIQRPAEAASSNLILMAVLFIPILIGLRKLYPWWWPSVVAADPVLIVKKAYLNPTFFTIRAAIYFAIWIAMAVSLTAGSRAYDRTRSFAIAKRMRAISAAGILIIVVSVTLAGVDWMMSRDAHWFSSIFGFIIATGQAFTGLLFVILILVVLSKHEPLKDYVTPQIFNDLGNLVLTLVILWAYLSFAQFLISWTGNIRDEVHWYKPRMEGVYGAIGCLLIFFHFFFPFFLLLIKQNKRKPEVLAKICIVLLVFRLLDIYWLVIPTGFVFPGNQGPVHDTGLSWANLVLPIGIGGLWLAAYVRHLGSRPLLAVSEHEEAEISPQVNHGDASTRPA